MVYPACDLQTGNMKFFGVFQNQISFFKESVGFSLIVHGLDIFFGNKRAKGDDAAGVARPIELCH